MFLNGSGENVQSLQRAFHSYLLHSFGSFGQAVSEENIFLNRSISNKNCLCQPCLLTNWHDMSYFNRGLSTDGPTKFRFIWPSGFRGEEFFYIDQSEKRIACCGNVCLRIGTKCALFIEGLPQLPPTKFWFIWRRGFRENLLDIQKQELPVTVMFVNISEENEHSLKKIFLRCFVPSVG